MKKMKTFTVRERGYVRRFRMLCLILLLPALGVAQGKELLPKMNVFVDSLLQKMTLEEKVGQLTIFGGDSDDLKSSIKLGKVGGTNGMLPHQEHVKTYLRELQEEALKSRLGIPLLLMGDVIHGYRTTFPINIATACTWDPNLIKKMDSVSAVEATTDGMNWTFAPMLDISRDPRWGRVIEGAGEDPFLASKFAEAGVRGFQGEDLADPHTMAATAKHFAGYGAVEAGRDYNTVDLSWRSFYEIYLPPFQAAIRAGLASVMPGFVAINGIPASGDPQLLNGILREENAFDGLVVSDYDAIPEMLNHRVASTPEEAAQLALTAGIDMDLHSQTYLKTLPELYKLGAVTSEQIDNAVKKVLELKYKLGLFDNPFLYDSDSTWSQEELLRRHRPLARRIGRESIVLLKNDTLAETENPILPLAKNIEKLGLIGPMIKNKKEMLGAVHALGKSEEVISIWEGIKDAVSSGTELLYAKGTDINTAATEGFKEAVSVAKQSDLILLAVGEDTGMSGEGDSRSILGLPGNQLDLVKAVAKTGTPVVLLLINGRPLTIPWLDNHIQGIVETWQLGTETGHAIADVLFGDYNPSGKLVMTFPRNTGQIPIYYNHLNTGRPKIKGNTYTSRYVDIPNSPLYPFGYGLSYTQFSYSSPKLNRTTLKIGDTLSITVKLKNIGKVKGTEVSQLYISQKKARISPPVKKLRGFKKTRLAPGETKILRFKLTAEDFSFYDRSLHRIVEPGEFEIFVGGSSDTDNQVLFKLEDKP